MADASTAVIAEIQQARVDAVYGDLSNIMEDMEAIRRESEMLRSDVEFTESEVSRLRGLVVSAEAELHTTQEEVEQLLVRREDSHKVAPSAQVYSSIQRAEEENSTVRLEIATMEQLYKELLKEVRRETDLLESLKANSGIGTAGGGDYIAELTAITSKQQSELQRYRFTEEQLAANLRVADEQEDEILRLRQQLESCGVDVPMAPVSQRTNRLRRQRERAAAMNTVGATTPKYLMMGTGDNHQHISLIRSVEVTHHEGWTYTERSFEVPCGYLLPLTNVLGPLRHLAKDHDLQSCVVAQSPSAVKNVSAGDLASTKAGTKSTFLVCKGAQVHLDRFERFFLSSLQKASLLVTRFDGLVTYRNSFGAMQQEETARKLLAAVTAPGTSSPPRKEVRQLPRAPLDGASPVPVVQSLGDVSHGAQQTPANSGPTSQRRVNISSTPMTIVTASVSAGRDDSAMSISVQEPSGTFAA